MRRILVVSDFFTPHWTGVSKSIEGLTGEVVQSVPVTVLTVQYDKKLPLHVQDGNLTIQRIPYLTRFSRTYLAPALIVALIPQVIRHDTILINSPCTYVLPAALLAKLFRKRLVLFHQGDLVLPQGSVRNALLERIFDLMTHAACVLADSLATYTQDYAHYSRILSRYPAKVTPFIPPLLFPPHPPNRAKPDWQQIIEKKKKAGYLIVGCAGRFVEEKGLDVLFEALQQINRSKKHKVHVLYAGASMPYENYLERYRDLLQQLGETITFTGLLHTESLGRFYSSIDLFVLPSRTECFGLVQAEALHFDKPVIVSDIPGARYLTRTYGCGQVIPVNNPTALAHAIQTFSPTASMKKKVAAAREYLQSSIHRQALQQFLGLS